MIKPGTGAEVTGLVESLASADEARREAAVARLTIIGPRALGRLLAAYDSSADRYTHVAILRVMEAVPDERALSVARQAVRDGGDIAVAAVAVLRALLNHGTAAIETQALGILLELAADPSMERRVRSEAASALQALDGRIQTAVAEALPPATSSAEALWQDAMDGRLPDDPAALRQAVDAHRENAPLASLRRLVEAVRNREGSVRHAAERTRWCELRGALHQALALRGSRVALYDLRETVARADGPLPPSFLGALQVIGDESCLEAIAAAHTRAPAAQERWRFQLARTFHALARRERLTRKHSAVRRALAKAPELAAG